MNEKPTFYIRRIITRDPMPSLTEEERIQFTSYCIIKACEDIEEKVNLIQTPGGLLKYKTDLSYIPTGEDSRESSFNEIISRSLLLTKEVLTDELLQILSKKTNNLTLGVDVFDKYSKKHVELIGTYCTKEQCFKEWTGKSYPVMKETNTLLYCLDYNSHFQKIDGFQAIVLGCHDLNIFSPRSRESCDPDGYKGILIAQIQKMCDEFKPIILLQHPHTTDSTKTWLTAWSGVKKFIPSIQIYSAAFHYKNIKGGLQREPLDMVLSSTASRFVDSTII